MFNVAKSIKIPGTKSLELGFSLTGSLWIFGPSFALSSPYGFGFHVGPVSVVFVWLSNEDIEYREQLDRMFGGGPGEPSQSVATDSGVCCGESKCGSVPARDDAPAGAGGDFGANAAEGDR